MLRSNLICGCNKSIKVSRHVSRWLRSCRYRLAIARTDSGKHWGCLLASKAPNIKIWVFRFRVCVWADGSCGVVLEGKLRHFKVDWRSFALQCSLSWAACLVCFGLLCPRLEDWHVQCREYDLAFGACLGVSVYLISGVCVLLVLRCQGFSQEAFPAA